MRKAICIGSDGPRTLGPLRYTFQDARGIGKVLASICGFDEVLHTRKKDPFELKRILANTATSLGSNDTFLIYFSGHGMIDGANLYLLLADSNAERLLATALPAADLLTTMSACRAKERILILDCCNAGQVIRQAGIKSGTNDRIRTKDIGIVSDTFDLILASDFLEFAKELNLLKGRVLRVGICTSLQYHFAEIDQDGDGALSIDELMRWLEDYTVRLNRSQPPVAGTPVPIPKRAGVGRGQAYITKPPLRKFEWPPIELPLPDGMPIVVLPLRFWSTRNADRNIQVSCHGSRISPVCCRNRSQRADYTGL